MGKTYNSCAHINFQLHRYRNFMLIITVILHPRGWTVYERMSLLYCFCILYHAVLVTNFTPALSITLNYLKHKPHIISSAIE